jgi:hypothetical protein
LGENFSFADISWQEGLYCPHEVSGHVSHGSASPKSLTGLRGQGIRAMLFHMKRLFVITFLTFGLVACGSSTPIAENPTPSEEVASSVSPNLNKGGVTYSDYAERTIGRGKSVVLFFFKPSDPFSEKNDGIIKAVYGTGAAVVSTYRLNYPTATGARLKYGVIVEDTFVLLDASGQRVANFIHPTEDEIRIILRGNIPVPAKK